jgi:hypothetical protein
MAAAFCKLGDLHWRVDPNLVSWTYNLDTTTINTLGGQVIQVLGSSLSDMTIVGDFGQPMHKYDPANQHPEPMSWQLATRFHHKIKTMMDQQMQLAYQKKGGKARNWVPVGAESTWVKSGWRLTYMDGVHNWDFTVMIKALVDGDGSGTSITYSNGKFNHGYALTLFILQAGSDVTHTITSDAFITRIAKGVGWTKKDGFHGPYDNAGVEEFIQQSGNGIYGYLSTVLTGQNLNQEPGTTPSGAPVDPSKSKNKTDKTDQSPQGKQKQPSQPPKPPPTVLLPGGVITPGSNP